MLSPKEQRQMWMYIILLAVIIGGLWFIFFKKQIFEVFINDSLKEQVKAKQEPSLGEIFSTFGQSVSKGVQVFSEIKNQLPETATSTISTTTDNFQPKADQPMAEVK